MKKIVNKIEYKMPATIDDLSTLDEIKEGFLKFFDTLKPE